MSVYCQLTDVFIYKTYCHYHTCYSRVSFSEVVQCEMLSLFEQRLKLRIKSTNITRHHRIKGRFTCISKTIVFDTSMLVWHWRTEWTWCYCILKLRGLWNIWLSQMIVIYFLHGQESLILLQTCLKNNFIVQYCIVLYIEYFFKSNVLFDHFSL